MNFRKKFFGSPVSGGKELKHDGHKGTQRIVLRAFSLRDLGVLDV